MAIWVIHRVRRHLEAEHAAHETLAIALHPEMIEAQVGAVASRVTGALKGAAR
jgi:hypothetical protein